MPDPAAQLARMVAGVQARLHAAGADLAAGRISIPAWEIAMRDALKPLHLAAARAGAGGDRALAQPVAASELRTQYRYLEGFRQDLIAGTVTPAETANRSAMYADAAHTTFYQAMRVAAPSGSQERRELGPAEEHCTDCVAEANKGWQPVGTLRRIGDSACIIKCRCAFRIRPAQEAAA